MKIRGLFKKAAATLMAAVTALSILPATTAFAAGDIGTISFSHTYDSSGNAMRYNSMTVVFLLQKYRMELGQSVKSKARKVLYSPRKKSLLLSARWTRLWKSSLSTSISQAKLS